MISHRNPSALTASEAWLRGRAATSPARERRHPAPAEFHCGKPPPAPAPRTIARNIVKGPGCVIRAAASADFGAGVAVDLKRQRDFNDARGFPSHVMFLPEMPAACRETEHGKTNGIHQVALLDALEPRP